MLPLQAVLSSEQVGHIRTRLSNLPYRDGALSVGALAKEVKHNEQADLESEVTRELQAHVRETLAGNALFSLYARPVRWSRLLFARYGSGHEYGRHYDNWNKKADDEGRMRSDMSFTLFLADPDTYEGGELVLERPEGPLTVKMPAGSVFLYPTGVLHHVRPVTAGERHVCVGWIQSQIRNEDQRALLFDLDLVLANLPEGEPRLILAKSINSLLRMWGDV